jgi:DNA-binding CsgD family transcriptional regulator
VPGEGPVGRQQELARLDAFLDAAQGGLRSLAIVGPAGIGKTTIWREGVRRAGERGFVVLSCRPSQAEARFAFSGLGDLLETVGADVLGALPLVQRRAIDAALVRSDSGPTRFGGRAVPAGVLSVLQELAGASPVVVAVDDLQWLDAATATVLTFAVRRLEGRPLASLVSVRAETERPDTFERSLPAECRTEIELGPVSVASLHEILKRELSLAFPRPTLVRIADASGGNPFYALEVARELARSGAPGEGRLPVPREVRTLARARLARLPRRTRDALLTLSSLSRPTTSLVDVGALAAAEEAEIVHVDGEGRIRYAHPLLASAVYETAPAARRRLVHRRLAELVEEPEERARHLALASDRPDEAVAAALEAAADRVAARGAPASAAELAGFAARLTPPDLGEARARRGLALGNFLYLAGDTTSAIEALEAVCREAPPGPSRNRSLVDLGGVYTVVGEHARGAALLDEAIEAIDDPVLAATAHARRAWISWLEPERVIAHCRSVLELIDEEQDPAAYSFALQHLACALLFTGRSAEHGMIERSLRGQEHAEGWTVSSIGPRWPLYFDDLATARSRHRALASRAGESGNEAERQSEVVYLGLIELWSGHPAEAEALASEALELAEQIEQQPMACVARYVLGLTEVQRGRLSEARALARANLSWIGPSPGPPALVLETQTYALLGSVALAEGSPAEADAWFSRADEAIAPWPEPAPYRYHGDHAEAVIALGDHDRAEALVRRMEERAARIPRPWLCAVAARSRGLLCAARGDLDGALAAMREALDHHSRLEMPFERARTLVVFGQLLRRRKKRREARAALQEALGIFEQLGAPLWAERARAELGRMPVRRAPGELTPTEETIAGLAASGLTNRVIAERIFVSPKTVESNLARVYRKLGIRSRAELGRAMAERERLVET